MTNSVFHTFERTTESTAVGSVASGISLLLGYLERTRLSMPPREGVRSLHAVVAIPKDLSLEKLIDHLEAVGLTMHKFGAYESEIGSVAEVYALDEEKRVDVITLVRSDETSAEHMATWYPSKEGG